MKRKKLIPFLSLIFSLTISVGAFAYVNKSWAVNLPSMRRPILISSSDQKHYNSDNELKVKLEKMGGDYERIYAMATSDGKDATKSYLIYKGQTISLPYNIKVNSGDFIRVFAGNDKWSIVNVYGSGVVYFP